MRSCTILVFQTSLNVIWRAQFRSFYVSKVRPRKHHPIQVWCAPWARFASQIIQLSIRILFADLESRQLWVCSGFVGQSMNWEPDFGSARYDQAIETCSELVFQPKNTWSMRWFWICNRTGLAYPQSRATRSWSSEQCGRRSRTDIQNYRRSVIQDTQARIKINNVHMASYLPLSNLGVELMFFFSVLENWRIAKLTFSIVQLIITVVFSQRRVHDYGAFIKLNVK